MFGKGIVAAVPTLWALFSWVFDGPGKIAEYSRWSELHYATMTSSASLAAVDIDLTIETGKKTKGKTTGKPEGQANASRASLSSFLVVLSREQP